MCNMESKKLMDFCLILMNTLADNEDGNEDETGSVVEAE